MFILLTDLVNNLSRSCIAARFLAVTDKVVYKYAIILTCTYMQWFIRTTALCYIVTL